LEYFLLFGSQQRQSCLANQVGDPPLTVREVGWGAVHFVRSPDEEPVLEGLGDSELVVHWHGDTFDLPEGAALLASTLPCKNQMFRLRSRLFGVQFHPELDAELIALWVEEDADYVRGALGPEGAARIAADTALYLPRLHEAGDRLLDNLVHALIH
jgi:GMP synthase-like glutamine amidotransferase